MTGLFRVIRLMLGLLALCAQSANAQQQFALDATFRAQFNDWYVSSILPLDDGKVILSGQIKYLGDQFFRLGVRLNANGTRDLSFANVTYMGGKLTEWNEKVYAQNGIGVRRLFFDGVLDNSFNMVNAPYFSALQGGDYHVYPDGSLLVSGAHTVNHPDSGWNGLHNLIWFTNTGRLDSTRAPRKGNGVIYDILELPDGKFICTGPMTVYEGQPTSHVFRVHADGTLDTSFFAGVEWGRAYAYLPLDDGRCYVGGLFRIAGSSINRRLVRFLPDGNLDPTFNNALEFDLGTLSGSYGIVSSITPLSGGRLLVTGGFQLVDGIPHNGICIVDSTGQVVPQLEGQGCGTYLYQSQNSSALYGSIVDVRMLPDNMMYIWGTYHGYSDGTTNDPLQRFVTRLHGPDFSTGVEATAEDPGSLRVYPNPASSQVVVEIPALQARNAELVLKDAMGRVVLRRNISGQQGQVVLAVESLAEGLYLLEVLQDGQRTQVEKLVVQ
jgi:hypothetical protein